MLDYNRPESASSFVRLKHLRLERVPPKGSIGGIVTCGSLEEIYTHWVERKTVGCPKPICPMCEAKVPRRIEGYVSLLDATTRKHFLLGMTPLAIGQILEQVGRLHRLRGLILRISRKGSKPNGRLVVEATKMLPDTGALPAAPDVMLHLQRIWGVEHLLATLPAEILNQHLSNPDGLAEQLLPGAKLEIDYDGPVSRRRDDLEGQTHFPQSAD